MTVKQVIVVRKDLNMPMGKLLAQVSHASMAFMTGYLRFTSPANRDVDPYHVDYSTGQLTKSWPERRYIDVDEEMALWIDGAFTKVVVSVPDEQTLLAVYTSARTYGLRHKLITDEGRTVFNGVPTNTCIAIGPNFIERVDAVTKSLPLYR